MLLQLVSFEPLVATFLGLLMGDGGFDLPREPFSMFLDLVIGLSNFPFCRSPGTNCSCKARRCRKGKQLGLERLRCDESPKEQSLGVQLQVRIEQLQRFAETNKPNAAFSLGLRLSPSEKGLDRCFFCFPDSTNSSVPAPDETCPMAPTEIFQNLPRRVPMHGDDIASGACCCFRRSLFVKDMSVIGRAKSLLLLCGFAVQTIKVVLKQEAEPTCSSLGFA